MTESEFWDEMLLRAIGIGDELADAIKKADDALVERTKRFGEAAKRAKYFADDTDILVLDIPNRAKRVLRDNNVRTVSELERKTVHDLTLMGGLGMSTIMKVVGKMSEIGRPMIGREGLALFKEGDKSATQQKDAAEVHRRSNGGRSQDGLQGENPGTGN